MMSTHAKFPDFVNLCDLDRDPGPCNTNVQRYFYDRREQTCRVFEYGGCGGNDNNFGTVEQCQSECMGGVLEEATRTTTTTTTLAPTTPAPTPPETIQPPRREIKCESTIKSL